MIIEITTDKKGEYVISDNVLDKTRDFMYQNIDQWIKGKDISNAVNYTTIRVVINKLRNEGMPIVSGKKGYKLTTNKNEIKQCYQALRIRALRAYTAAKKMKMLLGTEKTDF